MKKIVNLYCDLLIHDFGTILQNIQTSTELGSKNLNEPDKIRKYLSIINKQVIRGTQLISNVINISKIDNSKNPMEIIDVLQILRTSIGYIESLFQENKLKIEFNNFLANNIPFKGLFIQGDELIRNVFENILFNAIYHNKNPKTQITVNVSREILKNHRFVKIEFIDNGIGISDEKKKVIFQESIQIQNKKKGKGFGLTLVQKLIKKYNGYIWIEDNVIGKYNKGSRFIIMIPEIYGRSYILT